MNASRQTKIRSIVVLIVAAVILELTTAVQYFSSRHVVTEQLSRMAQHDLNNTGETAKLRTGVERALNQIVPDVERLYARGDNDSLREVIRHMVASQTRIVGVDFCRVVGDDDKLEGVYIYRRDDGKIGDQVIGFDFTKRSWYSQALTREHFWSEPYRSHYKVMMMCTYSRPIRNAQGETVAVLGADVPLNELSALVAQLYDNQHRSILPIILLHLLGLIVLAFIIQYAIFSVSRLQDVDAEKKRIEGELNIARGIQQAMLPKTFPPYPDRNDVDIYASLTPAREVGGDFYDFLIRDEKLFFCIGDVSGKGVPAALVMAVARSMFRMLSARESAPDRIVSAMNDMMAHENDYNMFITLFVGVLDLPTGRLRYTNAGHKAPLIDGQPLTIDPNLPVGTFIDFKYNVQETIIPYGSIIFLYTDGLTEAENQLHSQFGDQRMTENMQMDSPHQLVEKMDTAVHAFVGEHEQSDDLTMLAIRYTRKQSDVYLQRSLTLPCDINQTSRLAEFVDAICGHVGFSSSTTMQMNLALEEAVVNVMNYAYPSGVDGEVTIEAMANSERLKFVITDSGQPFDPTSQGDVDTTLSVEERNIGGLGIYLMRLYMDSINYERIDGKNILTMRKKITDSEKTND